MNACLRQKDAEIFPTAFLNGMGGATGAESEKTSEIGKAQVFPVVFANVLKDDGFSRKVIASKREGFRFGECLAAFREPDFESRRKLAESFEVKIGGFDFEFFGKTIFSDQGGDGSRRTRILKEATYFRGGKTLPGEKNPTRFFLGEDGNNPFDESGVAAVNPPVRPFADLGAEIPNLEAKTAFTRRGVFHRLTNRRGVKEALRRQKKRQLSSKVVNRDAKSAPGFKARIAVSGTSKRSVEALIRLIVWSVQQKTSDFQQSRSFPKDGSSTLIILHPNKDLRCGSHIWNL